jgi:hypothetical protein
MAIGALQ